MKRSQVGSRLPISHSVTAALTKSDTEPSGPSVNRSPLDSKVKVEASEAPLRLTRHQCLLQGFF